MYDDYLTLTNNSLSTQYYYGLANGEVGLMVSSGYFYHLYNDDIYFDQCSSLLEMLVKKHQNEFSLGYGLAGLAWGIEQLNRLDLIDENCKSWMKTADIQLERAYREMILNNDFDYFKGASGILNYFIHKKELVQSTVEMTNLFIEKITELSSDLHFCNGKTKDSQGNFISVLNLGVPHGLSGTILLLLTIKEKLNIDTRDLIFKLTDRLLGFKQSSEYGCWIPCFVGEGRQSTLAWCYGDLPVILLLTKIGNFDNRYEQQLNFLSLKTIQRDDYFKDDLTLCHGIPIISYFYFKLWKLTRQESYFKAYLYWKEKSFTVFKDINSTNHKNDFLSNSSLFNGFSGYYIAHLTMSEEISDEWDNCLLF